LAAKIGSAMHNYRINWSLNAAMHDECLHGPECRTDGIAFLGRSEVEKPPHHQELAGRDNRETLILTKDDPQQSLGSPGSALSTRGGAEDCARRWLGPEGMHTHAVQCFQQAGQVLFSA